MGGKSSPPPPDYGPLAESSKEAAQIMAGLGREQMATSTALGREQIAAAQEMSRQQTELARQLGQGQLDLSTRQYEDMLPIFQQSSEAQLAAQAEQMRQARDYYDYQTGTFRPLEQGIVRQAQEFNTGAYREQLASQAAEDAARAFSNMQGQTMRGLDRRGVSTGSGNAMAMANQNALAAASMRAGAMTGTRERAEQLGYARQLGAAELGRGLAGSSAAAYAGAGQAGAGGLQAAMAPGQALMAGQAAGANTILQGLNAGTATAMQGYGAGAGTIMSGGLGGAGLVSSGLGMRQQGFGNILGTKGSMYAAGMNQSDPFMDAVGTGIGAYAAFKSDRRLKQDIELVGRDERTMLPLYEFAYKSDPSRRFLGVMADEVEAYMPEAVGEGEDGYKFVNYAMLGIEMVEV